MLWNEKYGPWALVTGASAGLGADFVRQIAAKGVNTVLVARRKDRLEELVTEIQATHQVKTRIIVADLTASGACQQVTEDTMDLEIGLLVNNAGFGMSGNYQMLDAERQVNMTVLNCVVPVILTNHYLPPMIDRRRGGVIFLASIAGYQPTATFATYGATKAFNLMLGEALWRECRSHDVDVLSLSPGFTSTEFSHMAQIKDAGSFRVAKSKDVVAWGLRNLGKKGSTVQGLLNFILSFTVRIFPRRLVSFITHMMLKGRTKD